jgi:hypothetical protein
VYLLDDARRLPRVHAVEIPENGVGRDITRAWFGAVTVAVSAEDHGLVVWSRARSLLRVLRPVAWLVLLDVVLDAEWRDGSLVASTSVRLVADHLRLDPGTVASALRVLRTRGVVELLQASGSNGRFGLAAYILRLPDGVEVLSPCADAPHTDNSDAVTLPGDDGLVLRCRWSSVDGSPSVDSSYMGEGLSVVVDGGAAARTGTPSRGRSVETSRPVRRSSAPEASGEQGVFDLGSGAR